MKKYDVTESLRRVLTNVGIPEYCYSIGGYSEGCPCIERTVTGYVIYVAERANRYDEKKYENPIDACNDIISRIALTKEDEKELKKEFKDDVINKIVELGYIK